MKRELNFQEYAGLLGEGLFADNVILSLMEYRTRHSLGPKEKATLKRARHFLDDVITGSNLAGTVFSSAHDVAAAKAYKSVHSRVRATRSKDFSVYVKGLRGTVDGILRGSGPSEPDLEQLDDFFSNYGSGHFQRAKASLEVV